MSSGPPAPDAASMPMYFYAGLCKCFRFLTCLSNAREEERNARRRITYSREFLLSVGGSESEACKKLPAGIDTSLLSEMKWHWGSYYAKEQWRSEASGAAAYSRGRAERWSAGSHDREDDSRNFLKKKEDSPECARESESFQTGVGSKSKPCPRFFSTAGCLLGEGCHFVHYFPAGGHRDVAKMTNPAHAHPPGRMPTVKSRLCTKYNTAEGCKWGDNCHFAHGERELGKDMFFMDNSMPSPMGPQPMPNPAMVAPAIFGASATAKISVDASFSGVIIGRGGVSIKEISRVTGAKLAIWDHESETSLKNIELEGTFDQIKNASTMVTELIVSIGGSAPPVAKNTAGGPGSNFKTRLCENFTKGSCTFGYRCRFDHGENELRKSAAACLWQKKEKSAAACLCQKKEKYAVACLWQKKENEKSAAA